MQNEKIPISYLRFVIFSSLNFCGVRFTAEGGTRTHTPLREADFKSAASAIPPPRRFCYCRLHRPSSQRQYPDFCLGFP